MGRRYAGIVALLCLGELLEDSLDATSFITLGVLDFRALIRGRSLLLSLLCLLEIFEIVYWWWHELYDDMANWRLICFNLDDCWDILFWCWCNDVLFPAMFRESCYLCMLGDLIEDVTSRFLLCCIISVIYRFESLGCYKRLRQLHALPPSSHLNLSISSTEYSLCTNNS